MAVRTQRAVPLVLLGLTDATAWQQLASIVRAEGMGVALAHGERGCLRVAAAIGPDIILLDPRLPRALLSLLRAHPLAKHAQISWSEQLRTPNVPAERGPGGVASGLLSIERAASQPESA